MLWTEPWLYPLKRPVNLGKSPRFSAFVSCPQVRGLDATFKAPSSPGSYSGGQLLGQGGALPPSCSLQSALSPASTSQQERLLPHIPTGQSKYCFQEGWRVATRGTNPVISQTREPGSRVTQP